MRRNDMFGTQCPHSKIKNDLGVSIFPGISFGGVLFLSIFFSPSAYLTWNPRNILSTGSIFNISGL